MDAGVDEVLDLVDVGLGGLVKRNCIAVRHFPGKQIFSGKRKIRIQIQRGEVERKTKKKNSVNPMGVGVEVKRRR